MHLRSFEAIQNIQLPLKVDDLGKFIHGGAKWLATCPPNFHNRAQAPMNVLETAHKILTSRIEWIEKSYTQ